MPTIKIPKKDEKVLIEVLRSSWSNKARAARSVRKHNPVMADKMEAEMAAIRKMLDQLEIGVEGQDD